MNSSGYDGKKILITGASRGIGRAAVKLLLEKGAELIGTRNQTPIPETIVSEERFSEMELDLSNTDSLDQFLDQLDQAGWPEVVINNAGVFLPAEMTGSEEKWLEIWQKTMRINLEAPARICKRAVSSWTAENRSGILINIASRAAYRGDTQEYASYAATKGGLVALTKSIARGFGKSGITAFSIAPGFVETDMAAGSMEVYGEEYLKKDLVLEELAQPEDVAGLIAYLASGSAGQMTGSTFHLNGGSYMI